MDTWLEWARGPIFRFALLFMVLGMLRLFILLLIDIRKSLRQAGDKNIPYRQVFSDTLKWLLPFSKAQSRWYYSLTTIVFHVSVILVPIFLAGHIVLWKRGLGVSWPAISNGLADVLTLLALITGVLLIIERAAAHDTRHLARFQDFAIPVIVLVLFGTGYLAMHPGINPMPFNVTLFIHVMSANVTFVLFPTTKLSHCLLFPFMQFLSELAWHFPPQAGTRVGTALGREGLPI